MNVTRLTKSLFLAIAFLASGFSCRGLDQAPPAWQGLVLVAPAKPASRH